MHDETESLLQQALQHDTQNRVFICRLLRLTNNVKAFRVNPWRTTHDLVRTHAVGTHHTPLERDVPSVQQPVPCADPGTRGSFRSTEFDRRNRKAGRSNGLPK